MSYTDPPPPPKSSVGRLVIGGLSLLFIPIAQMAIAGIVVLATAACGNSCDQVATIWTVGLAIMGITALLLSWLLVTLILRRIPTVLFVTILLIDAACGIAIAVMLGIV